MNAEDKQDMKNIVELAVKTGNEPIWEKIRDHDTKIALNKQELEQGKDGQVAQGQRLGKVEQTVSKLDNDKGWVKWIIGIVVAVGMLVLGWYLKESP